MYLVLYNFIACVGSPFWPLTQTTGKFHHPEGHCALRPTVSLGFHASFLRGCRQSHSSSLICGCSGFPADTVSGDLEAIVFRVGTRRDKEEAPGAQQLGASALTTHPCPVSNHHASTISHHPASQTLANSLGTKSQKEASGTKSFQEQR